MLVQSASFSSVCCLRASVTPSLYLFSHYLRPLCAKSDRYRRPVWILYVKSNRPAFKCKVFYFLWGQHTSRGISALTDADQMPETWLDFGIAVSWNHSICYEAVGWHWLGCLVFHSVLLFDSACRPGFVTGPLRDDNSTLKFAFASHNHSQQKAESVRLHCLV